MYLDLVRLGAALVVVLFHTWLLTHPGRPFAWPGHAAVVVFFVLSGFVISHAARPGLGLRGYASHRIARIYPVVLAAVLLTIAITVCVGGSGLEHAQSNGQDWRAILLNMMFLGQSWNNTALPFNGPFWSLNYEVWYYVLFGIWCYHPSRLLLAGAALVAGPKVLLLMPVWLLGVFLHRRMVSLERGLALVIFLLSLGAGLAFLRLNVSMGIREAVREVWPGLILFARGSNQFVGDFLLGVIVSMNFLAAGSLDMRLLVKFGPVIRYLSGFTFSIYVFHMPLAVLIWNGLGVHSTAGFYGLLFAGIFILGSCTERRTKWYRTLLGKAIFKEKKEGANLRTATQTGSDAGCASIDT